MAVNGSRRRNKRPAISFSRSALWRYTAAKRPIHTKRANAAKTK